MAVAYTVTGSDPNGPIRTVWGTFTSASGDGAGETFTQHGFANITDAKITFDPSVIQSPTPKIAISGGTITWTVDDTLGLSGRWVVQGQG